MASPATDADGQKRCLYEILNIPRDATAVDIRSAYKRLALQLHPDKNPSASPAAFQQLQHAYEVLSDPKERSWYDSHRSQILFSDPHHNKHNPSSFADLDLFSYFSKSAYTGFSDTGKGFYKVYGDLFSKIYAQELFFVKQMGISVEVPPMPLIGNLESDYSQVTAFYGYWLGFSTVLDFGWVDEYDSAAGVNRRSRRAMEDENKKLRKKARREYNDTVRGLAAFAKKRDKRVVDMMMKKSAEEEKRKAEEKARKAEEERRKLERAKAYEEPEWARVDEGEDEDDAGGDEDDDRRKKEEFYCVVCSKKFKSDKQWKNHEQSKKHRDKVAELRMTFEEEDAEDLVEEGEVGETEGIQVGFDYEPAAASEDSDVADSEEFRDATDELCAEFQDDFELTEENGSVENNAEEMDDEASFLEAMISGKKNMKNKTTNRNDITLSSDQPTDYVEESYMEYGAKRRGRKNRASRKASSEPEAEVTREEINESQDGNGENKNSETIIENNEISAEDASGIGKESRLMGKNQKSKKQQVDKKSAGKKNAAVAPSVESKESKGRKQKATSKVPTCDTCGERFDTRNKLFAHLGDTGHAALKSK